MNGLDETHFVEFLETVYALERDTDEWLTQSLLTLSGLCGREHNYVGFLYDASNVEALKVWNVCRLQRQPPELDAVWGILHSIATPHFVRSTFRSMLLGSARKSASEFLAPLLEERERNGHGDIYCLNGLDPSGYGCVLSIGCRQREFELQPKQVPLLRRMVTHLCSAYRCRRRLEAQQPDAVEAILDAEGRVVHAEGAAQSKEARERIASAAAAIEKARTGSQRSRGGEALDGWHPLIDARWTLVDRFEENGRRYVVARENQADAPGFGAFTDRERQIVVHAALGLTNKEIAYTLGISHNTVRVLMARAARRLRVRSRDELLAHPTLRELRPGLGTEQ